MNFPIPNGLLAFAAAGLIVAIGLVFVQVPGKKDKFDQIGAWLSIIGGFGIGGISSGAFGSFLSNVWTKLVSGLDSVMKTLAGVGGVAALLAILIVAILWAWSRLKGHGIDSKSRFGSIVVVVVLSLVGTGIALTIGGAYGMVDGTLSGVTAIAN